jgi:hypothetical protein
MMTSRHLALVDQLLLLNVFKSLFLLVEFFHLGTVLIILRKKKMGLGLIDSTKGVELRDVMRER